MTCSCVTPVPVQQATRKGAARTVCAKCDLPIRLALERRRRYGAASSR
jgi:hypothetical protein